MESRGIFLFALLLYSVCISWADFIPEDDDPLKPLSQNRVRRFLQVRFKSRKPDPDAPDEYGIGFLRHLRNILNGGSFGVDFKIKYIDKIRKVLSDMWGSGKKKADWEYIEKEGRANNYGGLINTRVNRRPEP